MKRDARSGGVRMSVEGTTGALHRFRHQPGLVLNVVFELRAEMLEEAHDRECRSVAQCTNRPATDVAADRQQQVQIFRLALTGFDTVNNLIQPVGTFAAGRTLTA